MQQSDAVQNFGSRCFDLAAPLKNIHGTVETCRSCDSWQLPNTEIVRRMNVDFLLGSNCEIGVASSMIRHHDGDQVEEHANDDSRYVLTSPVAMWKLRDQSIRRKETTW